MSSHFGWDYNGTGKSPQGALTLLYASNSRRFLSDYWAGHQMPANIVIPQDNAILMSGTTTDIQDALRRDIASGIQSIEVINTMACWYFRQGSGWETHTVVSIASVEGYWQLAQNNPGQSGHQWRALHTGFVRNGAVRLDDLVNYWLPTAKGVSAWY